MRIISFCSAFLLSCFIINSCLHHRVAGGGSAVAGSSREALEIIIGGGGGGYDTPPAPAPEYDDCPPPVPPPEICPPPPPPPCPPPPPPPSPPPPPPPSPPPPSPPPPPPSPPPPSPPPPPKPPSRPPPKRPPPPSGFASPRIALVFPVIQRFKARITSDPQNVTKTWRGKDVCNYKGFKCAIVPTFKQTALAAVNFNGLGLATDNLGINDFIDQLPDVSIFHANSNNFTGPVPKISSTNLPFLFELDLSNNKYIGRFPYEVLRATNLTFLDLRFNTFYGTVPPEVFLLDLDVLFINNNNFRQTLPDNLGSTPVLFLTLANNNFTGRIPPSIGQASNTLIEVLFLNNQLNGCLPYEIGLLRKATVFDVGSNFLTGPIPHSFGCLARMEYLNLARNMFYGTVPEMVCKLPNMKNLTLSYNYFTQVGPACRNLIEKKRLDVKMNCILDLPNQKSAAECAAFFSMSKQCPNERSFNIIPCKYSNSEALETSDYRWKAPDASAPRSYGALAPNGL